MGSTQSPLGRHGLRREVARRRGMEPHPSVHNPTVLPALHFSSCLPTLLPCCPAIHPCERSVSHILVSTFETSSSPTIQSSSFRFLSTPSSIFFDRPSQPLKLTFCRRCLLSSPSSLLHQHRRSNPSRTAPFPSTHTSLCELIVPSSVSGQTETAADCFPIVVQPLPDGMCGA
ncbi:hypothetical protein BLNAU_19061 [Blattamonas nauphoetae]|uniref:Uncharacterized protein n=1 Tax=Blattamonas nauphoetae TaxID=2049346 RepID=A0ABQ9X6N7_9EUKA|nr:hypothetical protein BLNAU_19061 [Blattamonas nauphoetae]